MAEYETMVRVRMKNDLLTRIDAAAAELQKTRSDFIRDACRAALRAPLFLVSSATDGTAAQPVDGRAGQDDAPNP